MLVSELGGVSPFAKAVRLVNGEFNVQVYQSQRRNRVKKKNITTWHLILMILLLGTSYSQEWPTCKNLEILGIKM